jgi:hypothetical protein
MPDGTIKTDVLTCEACGAAISLNEKKKFVCVHCGKEAVPSAEYMALKDASDNETDARRRAECLAKKITAPGFLLFALGRFVRDGGYTLIGVVFAGVGAFVSMMLLFELQSFALNTLHVDLIDVMRENEYMALFVSVIAMFVGVVPVVAAFGLRTVDGRARLILGLAAHSPLGLNEAERCRLCGAPLPANPKGVLVAHCLYCSADNLIAVPHEILKAKIKITADLNASIETALAARRKEHATIRKTLLYRLGLVALPIGLTFLFFSFGDTSGRPNWRDAIRSSRLWMPVFVEGASINEMTLTYRCTAREDMAVLVALRHEEKLDAVVTSKSGPSAVTLETPLGNSPLFDERGTPVTLTVPHSGWFAITVHPKTCALEDLDTEVTLRFVVKQ